MPLLIQSINQVISITQSIAKENGHPQYTAAHMLKAVLHNEIGIAATLVSWGTDIHYLREWADLRIDQAPKAGTMTGDPTPDDSAKKVMEVAEMQQLKLGHDELSPEALLAALCKPNVGFSESQLKSFPLTEQEVLKGFVTEGGLSHANGNQNGVDTGSAKSKSDAQLAEALDTYCINKTLIAEDGKLDPILGRDKEIRQMIEVLGRRSKPNPIIVGEPGVGKTALVDGFAILLAAGKVPDNLKGGQLYELDSGSLIAGASYKGEIEDRLKKIVTAIKAEDKAILFIDEVHMLMDPAAGFGGAANLLKPELARGEITVIGATTNKEYREFIEGDPAFSRRFDKVIVEEPEVKTAIRMVSHIASKYSDHHGISLDVDTVAETVHLAKRYISEKKLPDAAIDLLDNTMSAIKMSEESSEEKIGEFLDILAEMKIDLPIEDFQWLLIEIRNTLSPVIAGKIDISSEEDMLTSAEYKAWLKGVLSELKISADKKSATIIPMDVAAVVASKTNIPIGKLQGDERKRLLSIEDHLRRRVVGQDGAIASISKAILESRAGLKKAGQPVGSFFFTGPTGTGKTELAKTLAQFLFNDEKALIRFDMSEFKESVSAALLYGASPGYVGYKEGGLLVNKIREKPYSIVLFDEIEKAHPSVFDVFLQLLDEGRLTDKQGKTGDFSNAVILFTSNLGQEHIAGYHEKEGKLPSSDWIRDVYLNDPVITFRPEFLGRLDSIVPFAPISEEVVTLIFNIQLKGLIKLLNKQGIQFEITPEAAKKIAFDGYSPKFGARPIRDVITKQLRQPLSQMIISGELSAGKKVHISVTNEAVQFNIK